MKNISILSIGCLLSLFASAKVITVNNNATSPGQYASLQQAIDSASAGDSIYVHGSATSYGNVTVKKRLNFFGTGHNPNKSNNLVSLAGSFQLDTLAGVSGASGSKITGFKLTSIKGYAGTGGTKNILISRNHFISGTFKINITGNGWTIENNIFQASYIDINNYSNIRIWNNLFNDCYITSSNQPTLFIANNIFLGSSSSYAITTVSNALIVNNIFSGSTPNGVGVNTNTFGNNITYQTANNTLPAGTNTGSGNLVAQDPKFTNVPANTFNYSYDFSLAATSPGINAGTDGTDIGIYGGVKPLADMSGSPAIPQVKTLTILNPAINLGDSLQVIIKAKKQN